MNDVLEILGPTRLRGRRRQQAVLAQPFGQNFLMRAERQSLATDESSVSWPSYHHTLAVTRVLRDPEALYQAMDQGNGRPFRQVLNTFDNPAQFQCFAHVVLEGYYDRVLRNNTFDEDAMAELKINVLEMITGSGNESLVQPWARSTLFQSSFTVFRNDWVHDLFPTAGAKKMKP